MPKTIDHRGAPSLIIDPLDSEEEEEEEKKERTTGLITNHSQQTSNLCQYIFLYYFKMHKNVSAIVNAGRRISLTR
jgi:hypothetical protein